jgi:selenocysteine lyase/cysteine desulfurase
MDRRSFLIGAGLGIAGSLTATTRLTAAAQPRADAEGDEWSAVRAQFDLAPDVVHLSGFFLASHPRPVRDAIERYRRMLDADPLQTVERAFGTPEEHLGLRVKRAAAAYLGGAPEEIALTQSTTMSLALIYAGLPLRNGQEILTSVHDHYSHHESIRLAAERSGASVRRIALFDNFADLPNVTEDALVERVRRAIRPQTRVVGLTWVHSQSGLKLPLRAIAAALREINAARDENDRVLFVVDGVHGLGCEDETIAETGCDAFAAGTHKWMFGPRGTGLIWARQSVWAAMRPTIPTFDDFELFGDWQQERKPNGPARASWFTPGGFHAFEHEWAVEAAFEFHRSLGRAKVAQRTHALNRRLKDGLAAMKHVKLYTPRSDALSAGLVGFDVEGLAPKEAVSRLLSDRILATESPYGRSVVRLSANIANTPEDIDLALAAVDRLARAPGRG